MFEKALLLNATNSLEQLSYIINGDIQNKSTPFLIIELCLSMAETTNGNMKFAVSFQPSLEELVETLNGISQIQLTESMKDILRLCDLFSYHPFQREVILIEIESLTFVIYL